MVKHDEQASMQLVRKQEAESDKPCPAGSVEHVPNRTEPDSVTKDSPSQTPLSPVNLATTKERRYYFDPRRGFFQGKKFAAQLEKHCRDVGILPANNNTTESG
jgi:hypothetical protein